MEIIFAVLGGLVVIATIKALRKKSEDDEVDDNIFDRAINNAQSSQANEATPQQSNTDQQKEKRCITTQLMYHALKEIGCQPEVTDSSIRVKYQGENFEIKCGVRFAIIWDICWGCINTNDPKFPNLREAINSVNYKFGPTVVYTNRDTDGRVYLHSRREVLLHPYATDNADYVRSMLDTFFDVKELLCNEFRQLNDQQQENQKNRRPIGFTTPDR